MNYLLCIWISYHSPKGSKVSKSGVSAVTVSCIVIRAWGIYLGTWTLRNRYKVPAGISFGHPVVLTPASLKSSKQPPTVGRIYCPDLICSRAGTLDILAALGMELWTLELEQKIEPQWGSRKSHDALATSSLQQLSEHRGSFPKLCETAGLGLRRTTTK